MLELDNYNCKMLIWLLIFIKLVCKLIWRILFLKLKIKQHFKLSLHFNRQWEL